MNQDCVTLLIINFLLKKTYNNMILKFPNNKSTMHDIEGSKQATNSIFIMMEETTTLD